MSGNFRNARQSRTGAVKFDNFLNSSHLKFLLYLVAFFPPHISLCNFFVLNVDHSFILFFRMFSVHRSAQSGEW